MSRFPFRTSVLALLFATSSVAYATPPGEEPTIENISKQAQFAEWTKCTRAIRVALANGISETTPITIDPHGPTPEGTYTLGQIKKMCFEGYAVWLIGADDREGLLAYVVGNAVSDTKQIAKLDPSDDLDDLHNAIEQCDRFVDEALAVGVPPTTIVDSKHSDGAFKGPLSSVKVEVCDKAKATADVWVATILAPYKKLLKNDKWQMILESYPRGYYVSASSGATSDPKQLAVHSVWFDVLVGDTPYTQPCANGAQNQSLIRFQFDKNQKLVKRTEKNFCGDPPDGAYR